MGYQDNFIGEKTRQKKMHMKNANRGEVLGETRRECLNTGKETFATAIQLEYIARDQNVRRDIEQRWRDYTNIMPSI